MNSRCVSKVTKGRRTHKNDSALEEKDITGKNSEESCDRAVTARPMRELAGFWVLPAWPRGRARALCSMSSVCSVCCALCEFPVLPVLCELPVLCALCAPRAPCALCSVCSVLSPSRGRASVAAPCSTGTYILLLQANSAQNRVQCFPAITGSTAEFQ